MTMPKAVPWHPHSSTMAVHTSFHSTVVGVHVTAMGSGGVAKDFHGSHIAVAWQAVESQPHGMAAPWQSHASPIARPMCVGVTALSIHGTVMGFHGTCMGCDGVAM